MLRRSIPTRLFEWRHIQEGPLLVRKTARLGKLIKPVSIGTNKI